MPTTEAYTLLLLLLLLGLRATAEPGGERPALLGVVVSQDAGDVRVVFCVAVGFIASAEGGVAGFGGGYEGGEHCGVLMNVRGGEVDGPKVE